MRFSVRHETLYRYDRPVRLAPHILRLNPRHEGGRMLAKRLSIEPQPVAQEEAIDRFGNRVTHLRFEGECQCLRVDSRFELQTSPVAPLPAHDLPPLPWAAQADDDLADYRADFGPDGAVQNFAAALAAERGHAALPFLHHLNSTLFARIDRKIRFEGAANTPAHTLASGRGACRDLTVLFMAACRSLGMPARFVSGYQAQADTPDGRRHLHAWPEVFLPGIGWRGFDPTHGTTVGDGHVALCAAPDQAATMPVEGGFYGNGVTATLDYVVEIATR